MATRTKTVDAQGHRIMNFAGTAAAQPVADKPPRKGSKAYIEAVNQRARAIVTTRPVKARKLAALKEVLAAKQPTLTAWDISKFLHICASRHLAINELDLDKGDIQKLLDVNLLIYHVGSKLSAPTAKGEVYLNALLGVSLPVQQSQWVMP